jgi:hypothetical protein
LNQIDIVQNEMDILRKIMAIQNRDLEIIERKLEATNAKTNLAKEKYLEKLAPQQKESFYKLEAEYTEAEKKLTTFLSDVSKLPMPAVGNPAEYIGSVVNEGFKKYSDKQQMAEFYADQLIILQLQFNSGDLADPRKNKIILEQRQSYIDDLVNHELNRFEKNEHEVKRRLYDYMYAKIKDIPKKRHQHRLGKFFCPLINEIVSKLTGGYKPFKSYKGGDDLVEPVSLQANYQTNGSFTANIHFNDSADLPIYQRDPTPKVVEPTQPAIFQRNWDTTAKNVSTTQNQAAAAPLPPIMMNPSAHATPTTPSIADKVLNGGVFAQEKSILSVPNTPGALPSYLVPGNQKTAKKQPATAMTTGTPGKVNGAVGAKSQNKKPPTSPTPKKPLKPSTSEEKAKTKPGLTSKPSQVPTPTGKATPVKIFSEKGLQAAHSATKANANAEAQSQKAFAQFKIETQNFLSVYGEHNGTQTNACINNLYSVVGKSMPYLWWPTAAVGGSALIGKSIELSTKADTFLFGKNSDTHALATGLPMGNSLIATDIIPLLKIYQTEGFSGIQNLEATLMKTNPYSVENLISAFKQQDVLDRNVNILAKSMKLDRNDPQMINRFFSNPSNVKMALDISMELVYHEQTIVQRMYDPQLTAALKDPKNIAMGSLLFLDSIHINGKSFSFSKYVSDPSNFDQRMNYFRAIFSEIAKVYSDPKKLKDYTAQMDRHRELANARAVLYHPTTADEPITRREREENAKFIAQITSGANNFWHHSVLPDTNPITSRKKQTNTR